MKKAIALAALVATAIALVACGGDDDNDTSAATTTPGGTAKGGNATGGGGGGGGATTVKLSADPNGNLKYDTDSLSAKAGTVTIDFTNPASVSHDVAVEDSSGQELGTSDLISSGDSTSLDLSNLKAGSYTFFCTVPGHREAGMEGTLTVK
jgi:plastocyanin